MSLDPLQLKKLSREALQGELQKIRESEKKCENTLKGYIEHMTHLKAALEKLAEKKAQIARAEGNVLTVIKEVRQYSADASKLMHELSLKKEAIEHLLKQKSPD